jgi:hypothetical protein
MALRVFFHLIYFTLKFKLSYMEIPQLTNPNTLLKRELLLLLFRHLNTTIAELYRITIILHWFGSRFPSRKESTTMDGSVGCDRRIIGHKQAQHETDEANLYTKYGTNRGGHCVITAKINH